MLLISNTLPPTLPLMTDIANHSLHTLTLHPAVVEEFYYQSELVSELKPVKDGLLALMPQADIARICFGVS